MSLTPVIFNLSYYSRPCPRDWKTKPRRIILEENTRELNLETAIALRWFPARLDLKNNLRLVNRHRQKWAFVSDRFLKSACRAERCTYKNMLLWNHEVMRFALTGSMLLKVAGIQNKRKKYILKSCYNYHTNEVTASFIQTLCSRRLLLSPS